MTRHLDRQADKPSFPFPVLLDDAAAESADDAKEADASPSAQGTR